MTPLRQKMINNMKVRGFAPNTQEAYLSAVAGLAKFFNRSPDTLNEEDVQRYLLHLMEDRKFSWSTCNVVVSALRFFYDLTIGNHSMALAIPPRKMRKQLPVILSTNELERLFCSTDNLKHRALLMTTYAAGLRVSEVVRLKPVHIESDRMMIRVEQGKGNRDRYTILSRRLLEELREYWKKYRPPIWLFPGKDPEKPMPRDTAQRIYYAAKRRAKIKRGKGIHILRHCFATHLLDSGHDPRTIQILMGHKSLSTTMVYLQVTRKKIASVKSPLDLLDIPASKKLL